MGTGPVSYTHLDVYKRQAMGLGSKEIADYFAQGGEAEVLLEALELSLIHI